MKAAIYAAWCHVASSNNNNFHDHWTRWTKQLVLVQNRSGKPEKGPNAVPKHVKAALMIFPMTAFFLMKCLHGKIQN